MGVCLRASLPLPLLGGTVLQHQGNPIPFFLALNSNMIILQEKDSFGEYVSELGLPMEQMAFHVKGRE